MKFVIKSYEGVGPLKLGMTKEAMRAAMPEEPGNDHHFRGPYTDHFSQSSVFAYYTAEHGICEAIEFCYPTIGILEGKPLNSVPFKDAKNWLQSFDNELNEEKFVGVTSHKLGVGLYAPDFYDEEDDHTPVEAVIVFRKGYYD